MMSEETSKALDLLAHLIEVEKWIKANDPRALPYLEADAVRMIEDKGEQHATFHPLRFTQVMLELERAKTVALQAGQGI